MVKIPKALTSCNDRGVYLCERTNTSQSTPPRGGGDTVRTVGQLVALISIHAPREGGDGDGAYAFFLDDEKYIYVGNVDIFQASSWTRGALNTAPVISDGGVAYERDGTVDISIASGILSIPKAAVPTVSIANCYTYVKAK